MIKKALAVAAAAIVAASAALVGAPQAGAVLPGVVDVAVQLEAIPSVVAPAGTAGVLEVVVSNVGVVATSAEVVIGLPAGSAYRDELSDGSCAPDGSGARCSVPTLQPGGSHTLTVLANTPVTPGLHESSASVSTVGLVEPLEYRSNNSDTAITDVRASNGVIAAGFVGEGQSMSLTVGDGRFYELTVPQGVPGVIVERLAAESGNNRDCGPTKCGDGFHLDFVEHPTYRADDPANPLFTTRTFGPQDPCQGLGGTCSEIYFAKDATATTLAPMLACTTAGRAEPSPCMARKYKSAGAITTFEVLLLSTDPLELPPLRVGK